VNFIASSELTYSVRIGILVMSFAYSSVAHDKSVIVEYPPATPTNNQAIASLLAQVDPRAARFSLEQGQLVYTALTDQDKTTFICCSDRMVVPSIRMAYVNELQREWRLKYGAKVPDEAPEFIDTLKRVEENYNKEKTRRVREIENNLEDARATMTRNMEFAMIRGDQLNEMEDQANDVAEQSQAYLRDARELRRRMCWERWKKVILIIFLVILVIAVFAIVIILKPKGSADEDDDFAKGLSGMLK
jgi:preprotein translocase subunit SecE